MINTLRSGEVFSYPHFPLRVIRVASHQASGLHRHEFHELVVILRGAGRHITDTEEYPLAAGDVFLIRGEMAHAYADTNRMTLVNILFDPLRLQIPFGDLKRLPGYHVLFRVEPKLRRHHGFRGRLRLSPDQLAGVSRLIALMESEQSGERPGYRFMMTTHLMQLFGTLSRCYAKTDRPERDPLFRMGETLTYIERNFDRPISVEQLADMMSMSESSLLRIFRNVVGKSPLEYVIHVRVSKAAELLQQGNTRVTEVAFACGFSDSNYFSRIFRRVLGCSPGEYRKNAG